MIIDRIYRPWLACATDDTRPALEHVLVERLSEEEAEQWGCNGVAVGANGYILVAVPVELAPEEDTCLVHRRFWPYLLRSCWLIESTRHRGETALIDLGKPEDRFAHNADGWACLKGDTEQLRFPAWRGIVPAVPEIALGRTTLGVSAEYLATVQRCLGAEHAVHLFFGTTLDSPIMVGGLGAKTAEDVRKPPFGIVMPMHVEPPLVADRQPVGAVSGASE